MWPDVTLGWCAYVLIPQPCRSLVLLLPATARPFPLWGVTLQAPALHWNNRKIFLGLLRLHGQTVAFLTWSLVLPQLPLPLPRAHPAAVPSSDPGGWGTPPSCPSPVARKKLHRAKKWHSANPELNPQPSMRRVCYFSRVNVPSAGAGTSAEDFFNIGASLASRTPGDLALTGSSCGGGGLVGQQAGQQEAGEHPEGPRSRQQRGKQGY